MKKGDEIKVRWVDASVYQSVTSPEEFSLGHQVGTSYGQFYGYLSVDGKRILVLTTTTFVDGEHGDYILIPIGCIVRISKLK